MFTIKYSKETQNLCNLKTFLIFLKVPEFVQIVIFWPLIDLKYPIFGL